MSFKHLLPLLFLITTPVAILATENPVALQQSKTDLEEKLGPTIDKDESLPLVDEGTINFIGGKVIEYYKRRQLHEKRSEERRVGKECRSRWSPDH